ADGAVLMRRNGSVHSRDSILAELQRSITAEARNYTIQSLRAESSGDLGYDTGIYNEDFHSHEAEGNYLMVIKRINGEWKIVAHAAVPNPRQKKIWEVVVGRTVLSTRLFRNSRSRGRKPELAHNHLHSGTINPTSIPESLSAIASQPPTHRASHASHCRRDPGS